jgi:hypothetical protein
LLALVLTTFLLSTSATAQDAASTSAVGPRGVRLETPQKFRWRVGAQIMGGPEGRSKELFVSIPVPTDWPEQRVVLVEQKVAPQFQQADFRVIDQGVTQFVAVLPTANPNQTYEISLVYEIEVHPMAAPQDPASYRFPRKAVPKIIRPYLTDGIEINWKNRKLTAQVKELVSAVDSDWDKLRVVYEWIRENIEQTNADPTTAVDCFVNQKGSPEDLNALFVACCRYLKVPARMVWVEGTVWSEFYLVDDKDQGYWFPANLAGLSEFGSISEPRVIQQKGDSIRVPEKEQPQYFVAEFVAGKGNDPPRIKFIQELLPTK